jgi:hypothetical protein
MLAAPVYLTAISIAEVYRASSLISDSYGIVYLPALGLAVLTGALGWLGTRRGLSPTA